MTTETKKVYGVQLKKCNQCDQLKQVSDFYKVKNGKFGVMATCKSCVSLKRKKQYHNNEEFRIKQIDNAKNYYQEHKNQVKAYVKQWMRSHQDYVYSYVRNWQLKNHEYYLNYLKQYRRKRK